MSHDSEQMTDESQKQRRPLWVIGLVLLLLYPLSAGPVINFTEYGIVREGASNKFSGSVVIPRPVEIFYSPLILLAEMIPRGEDLMWSYHDLCQDLLDNLDL